MSGRRVGTAFGAVLFWAALAARGADAGPAAAEAELESDKVRRAVVAYIEAVRAGDGEGLRGLIWHGIDGAGGDPSFVPLDAQAADIFVASVQARQRLELAADRAFGAAGARFRAPAERAFTPADRAALLAAACDVDDGEAPERRRFARVYVPGETAPTVLRYADPSRGAQTGGSWRVVIPLLADARAEPRPFPSPPAAQARLAQMSAAANALATVAQGIEAGRLVTADAAEARLIELLQRAMYVR